MSSFIDTNIFIYSIDTKSPHKQLIAHRLLKSCHVDDTFVSTQVLQELYNVATTKMKHSPETARNAVQFATRFNVRQVSINTIFSAININTRYQLSFWDSLILAAAIEVGCDTLYTEDLNDGQVVEGVKIVNPFLV